jgi:hypothetical protein
MTRRDERGVALRWGGVLIIGLFSFDENVPPLDFAVKIIFL